jgi:hypothetical protein
MQCTVDVRGAALSCTAPDPVLTRQAVVANRLLGGQDVYIRLTNVGGSYDAGAELFEINVTVQNLLADPLGTSDGTTVNGVRIFFPEPPYVTAGTGEVTLQNDSTGFITGPEQSYFVYNEILDPYEISDPRPWRFNVPTTVTRFGFTVYFTAPQADESQPLLDRVWDGSTSTDWADGSNWAGGAAPDSGSTAVVPADSLLPVSAQMPVLGANAALAHLRVGHAGTLGLGGNTLTAWGNVDVLGTISNGTLWMRGSGAVLRGAIPWLTIDGSVSVQGATVVTGAVKVMGGEAGGGTLIVNNYNPLTIVNPSSP